jgi:two-component system cell cycle response regulator DivK
MLTPTSSSRSAVDAAAATSHNPSAAESGAGAAPLVLLVDDDQHTREGWAEFLLGAGYRVSEASDGPEALAKIASRRPDIVLVDLGIPRLDGWELTRRIKSTPAWQHIAVVAVSGLDYPETLERITAAGCDAFLGKPCEPTALLAVIRGLLARRGR